MALGPANIDNATNALVEFARSLQRTGSDIVMEQDLATLFARFHIQADFLEEFKHRTLASTKVTKISKFVPIALQAGPGPSMQRALKDPAFMPMIIHLSMLASTHDFESLSEALSEVLAKRNESETNIVCFPSKGIRGTIQVCVEQTGGYKWHYLIDSITRLLGLPTYVLGERRDYVSDWVGPGPCNNVHRFYSLSWNQLNASLDILLAVQRVYSDHVMVIEGSRGVVTMVLWAHYLLGLTVLVKDSPVGDKLFGTGHASVIVQFEQQALVRPNSSSVYLTGPAPFNEVQLTIEDDQKFRTELVGRRMLPVRGYAKRLFSSLPEHIGSSTCLNIGAQRELSQYAAAFAMVQASYLYDAFHPRIEHNLMHSKNFLASNPSLITGAMRLVLDEFFELEQIQHLQKVARSLGMDKMQPAASLSLSNGAEFPRSEWKRISRSVFDLAHLILAFAAVGDPAVCEDFLISDALLHDPFKFMVRLGENNERYVLGKNAWYDAIGYLMQGKRYEPYDDQEPRMRSCLFSCFGWSIYKEGLVCDNPVDSVNTRIWIQKGVPIHNGLVARRVCDSPSNIAQEAKEVCRCEASDPSTDFEAATCAYNVTFVKPMLSTSEEEWKLNRRFLQSPDERVPVSIGYEALTWALEYVYRVSECAHRDVPAADRLKQLTEFKRNPAFVTTKGFYFRDKKKGPRVYVAQTFGNPLARWLALAAWKHSECERLPVLRKDSVCLDCFIATACTLDDENRGLYLIL